MDAQTRKAEERTTKRISGNTVAPQVAWRLISV